jgi:hypothetical protein
MNFFTDIEKDKSIKIGVSYLLGINSDFSDTNKSGFQHIILDQLKNKGYLNSSIIFENVDDFNNYDVILIDQHVDYDSWFYMFSKSRKDNVSRIFSNTRMYSLLIDMPDFSNLIKQDSIYYTRRAEISSICSSIKRIDYITKTNKLVLGDSHCLSLYTPGYMVSFHRSMSLFQALENKLESYILNNINDLIIYFGNFDVRHLLLREHDPIKIINNLISELESQLLSLNIDNISIRHLLPIEDESRKIGKLDRYKKLDYFGSKKDRQALSTYFNYKITEICNNNNWEVITNPDCFFNEKNELSFSVMEFPKSVHISRKYYIWDFDNNCYNSLL